MDFLLTGWGISIAFVTFDNDTSNRHRRLVGEALDTPTNRCTEWPKGSSFTHVILVFPSPRTCPNCQAANRVPVKPCTTSKWAPRIIQHTLPSIKYKYDNFEIHIIMAYQTEGDTCLLFFSMTYHSSAETHCNVQTAVYEKTIFIPQDNLTDDF